MRDLPTLARQVYRLRCLLFLTQGELAELFGVHPKTVSKWERGVARPTNWQADALEVLAGSPELARRALQGDDVPAVRLARGLVAAATGGGQLALTRSAEKVSTGSPGTP